jgi:leader peptidase (prepilin peptidase) / N-methyltransferase
MPEALPPALFIIGALIAVAYGAVVGSFLNVCIYRLPRGESIVHPPSHCPHCNTRLRSLDLVPILSFLLLGRKCRYCGKPITWRYALVEASTALLFLAVWFSLAWRLPPVPVYNDGFHPLFTGAGLILVIAACTFVATMLVTFVIDLETTYVIEPVTWLAMVAGVVYELTLKGITHEPIIVQLSGMTVTFPGLPDAVPGMVFGFLTFVALDLFGRLVFRKPGMGLGDAYIGAAIGAILGPGLAFIAFGLAVGLGALVGVVALTVVAINERRKQKAGAAQSEEEAPPPDLSVVPSLIAAGTLLVLAGVEAVLSRWLGPQIGTHGTGATVFALILGLLPVGALALASQFGPASEPESASDGEPDLPEGGFYMPFGPFLTGAAVLVFLAPDWVLNSTHALWGWVTAGNPLFGQ